MYSTLYIERRTILGDWEVFAYPSNDVVSAKEDLEFFREAESKKKYPKEVRLVRKTKEILA